MPNPTIAFVGFGEVNTPPDIILRKVTQARTGLEQSGLTLITTAPVTDDPAGVDCSRAIADLAGKQFDALVVCISGWIPSHAVIRITDEFRHLPMVLWGLSGWSEGGRLITTADQAGTTALRKTFEDLGYTFTYVYDIAGTPSRVDRVRDFCVAASARARLRRMRIGQMGYRDMKLYGTMFDGVSLRRVIGPEVECFDMLEMTQNAAKVADAEVAETVAYVNNAWRFTAPAKPETLAAGARYYCGLKRILDARRYAAVSLIDVDGMKKLLGFPPSMIFMLMANRLGIATIPENDVPGNVTQVMVKYLTGQCGAYLEFYEFMQDRVLMGVPDYVPAEIVDGPYTVRPAAFGQLAEGILNVSKLKTGRVTLCRLISTGDRYAMHIVTGEAVTPQPWEEAGWAQPAPQLPGLEIILDTPVERFAANVACQHYIVSYGDNTGVLAALCGMLGVTVVG